MKILSGFTDEMISFISFHDRNSDKSHTRQACKTKQIGVKVKGYRIGR